MSDFSLFLDSCPFQPTSDSTADAVISVASAAFSDSSSNTNTYVSYSNNSLTLTIYTVSPTIALTSDASSLKAGETANLTFTLSEASTDFVESDVAVSGGSLSNWTAVSSNVYTAAFTPTADNKFTGVIHIANDKFCDLTGNNNRDENDVNNTITLTIDNNTSETETETSPFPDPHTEDPRNLLAVTEGLKTKYPRITTLQSNTFRSTIDDNQGLNIDYNFFDAYGRGVKTIESKKEEGWGLKIIELSKTNAISEARNTTPGEEQQSVGIVLTKKPTGTVVVRASITNTRNLKIVNPKITFTPENWQTPQEIKLEGCANEDIKLTLTANAGDQGDFKRTEKDDLIIQILRRKSCNAHAIPSATIKPKPPKQIENTLLIESNFPEFNSPLFLMLRIALKPLIFAAKFAASWQKILCSKVNSKEEASSSSNHTGSSEAHITHDGYITADFFKTMTSPGLETQLPINNPTNEASLIPTNQLSTQESPSPWP